MPKCSRTRGRKYKGKKARLGHDDVLNAKRYVKSLFFEFEMEGSKMYTGKKVRLREYRKEDISAALQYINDSEVKRDLSPGIPYLYTLENETKLLLLK